MLQLFLRDNLEEGAAVYTDEAPSKKGLMEYEYKTVDHFVSEYVHEQAIINTIESYWRFLNRGFYGTYHHMSPKHLHRYVDEFTARQTLRKLNTIDMMKWAISNSVGKRLTQKQLIAKPLTS